MTTAITDLVAKVAYPYGGTNLPVVAYIHGWNQSYTIFDDTTINRIAGYGLMVVVVAMRGRFYANSPGLYRDGGRLDVADIADAITAIRNDSILGPKCHATKNAIVGYSGGGGNAWLAACRYPDLWNVVVAHCAMSDYGRNNPDGWYYNNNGTYTSSISTAFGGTPVAVPNNYYVSDATYGITNYTGGKARGVHDTGDTIVPVVHVERIQSATSGMSNFVFNISTDGTYAHGNPSDTPGIILLEPLWVTDINNTDAWTVPAMGTLKVLGLLETKRFKVKIKANGSSMYGLDAVATVTYGGTPNVYTVVPLTGAIDVVVTQSDNKSGTATNISVSTDITVA